MKLKILGILAILFVFVLGCTQLPACGNGICETGENSSNCSADCSSQVITPKQAILNGLDAIRSGGSITTQNFTLSEGFVMIGNDFYNEGYDSHSLIFATDDAIMGAGFGLVSDDQYTGVTFNSGLDFQGSARIYCQQTGLRLEDVIYNLNLDDDVELAEEPTSLCGETDYQPCCLIIIQN